MHACVLKSPHGHIIIILHVCCVSPHVSLFLQFIRCKWRYTRRITCALCIWAFETKKERQGGRDENFFDDDDAIKCKEDEK